MHTKADIDRLAGALGGGRGNDAELRAYHAAGLGRARHHGDGPSRPARARSSRRPSPRCGRPSATRRTWSRPACGAPKPPALPELSEPEVQRHYLHLSQETQGMMGISLFGTCTMKYNAAGQRGDRAAATSPSCTRTSPRTTLQGVLAIVHGFDLILRELSGMDQFVFQAGGGADAAYTHACVTRAYHAGRGRARPSATRSSPRSRPIPATPATAAAAGFKVVTLMLEENGYPSLDGAQGRRLRPHRGPAWSTTRTTWASTTRHQGVGADRPRGGRALLLRPRQLQRRDGQDPRARARLRRLHVHAAQDLRRAQGRRRAGRRRLWLHGGAGALPAGPGRDVRRTGATASTTTGRRAPARCASSGAMSRRC